MLVRKKKKLNINQYFLTLDKKVINRTITRHNHLKTIRYITTIYLILKHKDRRDLNILVKINIVQYFRMLN